MTPWHVGVDLAAAAIGLVAAALGVAGLYAGDVDGLAVLVAATAVAAALAAAVVVLLTAVPARAERRARPVAPASIAAADVEPAGAAGSSAAVAAPGSRAPALPIVEGPTATGDLALIEPAGSDRITLLAFLTSGCTTCSHFWSVFAGLAPEDLPGERTDLVIVTRGDDHENPARIRDLAPPQHLVIRSTMAWYDYGVQAGPYFVLVDGRTDVILGEGTATAWAEIDQLLRRAVGATAAGPATGVAE
jgi:hypothetical protein